MVILIVIWQFITAFIALIGVSAIAAIAFPIVIDEAWGPALPGAVFGLRIAVLILLCYIGIAVASGVGLLKGREWGRILGIVHSVSSLPAFPVGTVIGILSIIYLLQPEVSAYTRGG
jgi:hypothetical protein